MIRFGTTPLHPSFHASGDVYLFSIGDYDVVINSSPLSTNIARDWLFITYDGDVHVNRRVYLHDEEVNVLRARLGFMGLQLYYKRFSPPKEN